MTSIIFVYSGVSTIDRSWDPKDVKIILKKNNVVYADIFVNSLHELDIKIDKLSCNEIFWPTNHTITNAGIEYSIFEYFTNKNRSYIGPSPEISILSSKLTLKSKCIKAGIATPPYMEIKVKDDINNISTFPVVIKINRGADSIGVSVINSRNTACKIYKEFLSKYNERIFIEKLMVGKEYTVAFYKSNRNKKPLISVVEMRKSISKNIIDFERKKLSANDICKKPSIKDNYKIKGFVEKLDRYFNLNGCLRIDIIEDEMGDIYLLEINMLPLMSYTTNQLSYFPYAIDINSNTCFNEFILRVISKDIPGIL